MIVQGSKWLISKHKIYKQKRERSVDKCYAFEKGSLVKQVSETLILKRQKVY